MADYTIREVTTRRVEYVLKLPTNWVEIEKVLAGLRQNLAARVTYDDTVKVTSDGEELVFFYRVDGGGQDG